MAEFPRSPAPSASTPPARQIAAQPDLIAWNSVSPRAGLAWQPPHAHGLVLRGAFFRLYAPLAGRYLDYGNPNSLGGNVYQWSDANGDGWFEPNEQGALLARFGGPYSSISRALRRPYADEWNLGAEMPLPLSTLASIHLFRRDEKDRLAAIDTGVTAQDYTAGDRRRSRTRWHPRHIRRPTHHGLAQNPATLGHDQYLLTNPAGLRTLNSGFDANCGPPGAASPSRLPSWRRNPTGPTNPGNADFENDPGVVGALYSDPNTAHQRDRPRLHRPRLHRQTRQPPITCRGAGAACVFRLSPITPMAWPSPVCCW